MGPEIKDNPGHYHKHQGSLYSVEVDGTVIKRLSNVSISNGMAWSPDNKKFYYIDTYKFAVESYDFDIATGGLCELLLNFCVIVWFVCFKKFFSHLQPQIRLAQFMFWKSTNTTLARILQIFDWLFTSAEPKIQVQRHNL